MTSQVAGRERNRYLEPMVTRVVPSWDQNCTSWMFPLQSSLTSARFLARKMRALRDMGSQELGLRVSRGVMMFCLGHSQNHEGYLQMHWPFERVKVLPKVEPFPLALADEGVNVGPRDKGPACPWTPTWQGCHSSGPSSPLQWH